MLSLLIVCIPFAGLIGPLLWMAKSTSAPG
jgi:hypothetical protein